MLRKVRAYDPDRRAFVRAKLEETESSHIIDQRGFDLSWYTGVKDTSGIEIWEFNICSIPGIGYAVAKIDPLYGLVMITEDCPSGNPYAEDIMESDIATVVGDIFDNPELVPFYEH